MNALQLTDITEARGVYNKICHDIFMNARMYALDIVQSGFQIYASKIIIKHHIFL